MYNQYDDIVNRLNQDRLWDFPGGVHPPEFKTLSNQKDIARIPMPAKLYVTVKQHIGVEGNLVVEVGDRVLKGQALTRSSNPFSVPVHAPSSGTVTHIGPHVSAHPSGIKELSVEISTDEFEKWIELNPILDYQQKPKAQIVEAICNAGISGMGGAGFPTHIKASPKKDVEFLIVNGVECEPYISSDDRLMREHAWQIRQGIDVLVHLLSPKMVIVAIEDNKPEAIEAMQVACQENAKYRVVSIPTKYPAGGEKQLIQVLTNREVPGRGLPIDVGVIMHNVGTCYAIADAIFSGKPLIERVVTLTGEAFKRPQNVWAPIGTPISHLLEFGQYREHKQRQAKVIMGGPMMGFDVINADVPVVKITNCILAPSAAEVAEPGPEQPCIRCSACADACPASLLPQQLFWHSKAKEYDKAQDYNLFDCIECGACAYVCPSEIPLVHYYRIAKSDIRNQQHEKDQADKARERFEARKARLEREQKEREEKHAKAAEARRQAMSEKGSDAKDKIAAALARAKAKKQGTASDAASTEDAASASVTKTPESSQTVKQDKVAAAIARAKAKRAAAKAQLSETPDAVPAQPEAQEKPSEVKKEKVAIAIAKAKAKREAAKAARAKELDKQSTETVTAEPTSKEDSKVNAKSDKDTKVAAAIAKAKAKRQLQKAQQEAPVAEGKSAPKPSSAKKATKPAESKQQETPELTAAQIRKQKVEAAVAKAKEKNLQAKAKRDAAKKAKLQAQSEKDEN
ncbi:electron transport complex subunit RsxC [Aliiglaciecola sp. M165]|uniref:electron transport complex subunit RsxC n=1 Tax=Aliiglaciecola sp. M165 TaxID=2593649 RepID=UPI00117D16F6|nr:electron transport complex subunit RsxC [Aliiglaciecola sp. M165]TRY29368.1 electron transport complex subunit RsxC [Aliiglaciecola sp. M165]